MNHGRWMRVFGGALLITGWLAAGNLSADEGYALDDFKLRSAGDLVDVCTLESGHADYAVAAAFCYGFFEGATHYDNALTDSSLHSDIVCVPEGITRSQAASVIVEYIRENPQYGAEPPIDAVFRALIAEWPCPE
jgi:hypothetical protein